MHLSAQALTAAIEANIIHRACDIASRSPHMKLHDRPDTFWISSHIAHPYLNHVFRARFDAAGVKREQHLCWISGVGSVVMSGTYTTSTMGVRPASWYDLTHR